MQAAQFIRSQASRLWTLNLGEKEEVGAARSFCGRKGVFVRSILFFEILSFLCFIVVDPISAVLVNVDRRFSVVFS